MKNQLPVIVLLGASVLWGLSWLPMKAINNMGIGGIPFILISYGLLAATLTPMMLRQSKEWKDHVKALILIAILGGGANLAFTYALINGEVIRVMVLFYLLPVWGVLGGRFLLKESVDRWRWLGVILAVMGAFIILGGFRIFETVPLWIDLIAILSGLLFALNNLLFRSVQSVPVVSKITAMFYGSFIFAIVLIIWGVESFPQESNINAWIALTLYALLWLLVANIGSQWGVTHMEAGRSSIIIIMELITAVISASIIAGERMSYIELLGGAMILVAAMIEAFRTKNDNQPTTTIKGLS
jgi:drug/metabolite transporter (DMT)-like permease